MVKRAFDELDVVGRFVCEFHVVDVGKRLNVCFTGKYAEHNTFVYGVYHVAFLCSERLDDNGYSVFLSDRGNNLTEEVAELTNALCV